MTCRSSSVNLSSCAPAVGAENRSHFFRASSRKAKPASSRLMINRSRKFGCPSQRGQELEGFEEMLLTSRPKFVAMAYAILRNREDAEDAIQNAAISAFNHLRTFEGRSALTTWFTRIVLNAALMIQRKRQPSWIDSHSEPGTADDTTWTERIPTPQPDPEMLCAEAETFQVIDSVLGKMRPALRQAFTMTYYNGMSNREACTSLGVPAGTFKARLFRARRYLVHHAQRSLVARLRKKVPSALFSSGKGHFEPLDTRAMDISSLEVALS